MVTIAINNNKCKIECTAKLRLQLQKAFKIRHPNAFFIRKGGYAQPGWDGKIDFITDAGYFKTGLLPQVCKWLDETKEEYTFEDHRLEFNVKPLVPKSIGDFTLVGDRRYQRQAIKSIIFNNIKGLVFNIGVINAATNAGKTTIMAGLYLSYHRKIPAIILLKDGDLFEQFKKEIPQLIGEEDFGYVRGKEAKWNNFTIAMVQTLSRDIKKYKKELTRFGMVLVDEADEGESKSFRTILTNLYNTRIRVGLSGSIYMSKLAKDKPKTQALKSFFGDQVFEITKKDMVASGHSTPVVVKIHKGSDYKPIPKDWQLEYDTNITNNIDRAKKGLKLLEFNAKLKRLPALVICRYHKHIELLYDLYNKKLGEKYRVEMVHGGIHSKIRKELLEDFRVGKIDILISSFIIKRGKNHPLIRYIQNAAATDSQETISQIMGRGERTHESKKIYYLDDFFDKGSYLQRHSKHRVIYYQKEGFKVIKKY